MSEFMPEVGPGDRAKRAVRTVVPVLLLLVVVVWFFTIIGDYRAATAGDGGTASAEATGSVEATEAPGAAEGSADEQETGDADAGGSAEDGAADDEAQYVVVLIAGLNYREEPKADSEVMRTLPEGTRLVLLGQQNGWYQVRDEDGVTGWVSSSAQYVELVED